MKVFLLLLGVIPLSSCFGYDYDDETHVFGVNKVLLGFNENARELQNLQALRDEFNRGRRLRYTASNSEPEKSTVYMYFTAQVVCKNQTVSLPTETDLDSAPKKSNDVDVGNFKIKHVYVYSNGYHVKAKLEADGNYLFFKNEFENVNEYNVVDIFIYHQGCITTDPNCYGITKITKGVNPAQSHLIDLGKINLALGTAEDTECISLLSRVVQVLTLPFRIFMKLF